MKHKRWTRKCWKEDIHRCQKASKNTTTILGQKPQPNPRKHQSHATQENTQKAICIVICRLEFVSPNKNLVDCLYKSSLPTKESNRLAHTEILSMTLRIISSKYQNRRQPTSIKQVKESCCCWKLVTKWTIAWREVEARLHTFALGLTD